MLPIDTSELPELPKQWCCMTWGEISEWITYGFTCPMPHINEGIPIITAKHVINRKIDFINCDKTTKEAFENLSEKDRPKPGDILITKDGTIGRAAVVTTPNPFCINQSVAVVWLRSCPLNRFYLLAVIESPFTQKRIFEKVRGVALMHLSITDFAKMPLPIPSVAEQEQIVAELNRHLLVVDNLEQIIDRRMKQANLLRQSILKEAFDGKLVPQDPTDEPVEKLLDRIKEEKVRRETENKREKKNKIKNRWS